MVKGTEDVHTTYIKKMINNAGLANYKKFKMWTDTREEWKNYEKLQ